MKFEFQIEGMEELSKKLDRIAIDAGDKLGLALIEAGFRIQREAKQQISKSPANPRTGHSYPGNAPKTQTGTLVNSIYVNVERDGGRVGTVTVGTDLKYGQFLEFGTKRMAARPWLVPAFEATREKNMEAFKNAVFTLVKDAGRAA
jgi:HK97 gp10 family phage protein